MQSPIGRKREDGEPSPLREKGTLLYDPYLGINPYEVLGEMAVGSEVILHDHYLKCRKIRTLRSVPQFRQLMRRLPQQRLGVNKI